MKIESGIESLQRMETVVEKEELLHCLEFIRLPGGKIQLGTEDPIPCRLEGHRINETPVVEAEVGPFWICQFKVTNEMFEVLKPRHRRSPQSPGPSHPVVDVMYGEAMSFCREFNELSGMDFRLPTENEWVYAAAPYGWAFPYEGDEPRKDIVHVYGDGHEFGAAPVGDDRWPPNERGLDQMGHNVSEMTMGHYYADGHNGLRSDGAYCIAKGGNFGHCSLTPRLASRMLFDVAQRNPRVGFRLAHGEINENGEALGPKVPEPKMK